MYIKNWETCLKWWTIQHGDSYPEKPIRNVSCIDARISCWITVVKAWLHIKIHDPFSCSFLPWSNIVCYTYTCKYLNEGSCGCNGGQLKSFFNFVSPSSNLTSYLQSNCTVRMKLDKNVKEYTISLTLSLSLSLSLFFFSLWLKARSRPHSRTKTTCN